MADADETKEEREGPTPNGGVRSVAYFRDEGGRPCPKREAAGTEIVEYDASGNAVFRTYLQKPGPSVSI